MIYAGIVTHDEELALKLRRVLGETMGQLGKSLGCFSYENSYVFLNEWRRGERHFDVLLMDLSLLEEGTVEAAQTVKDRFPDTEMVWFSKTADQALSAFRLGVCHYLVLPVSDEEIREAILRCVARLTQNFQRKILVKSGTSQKIISLSQLEAVVSDDHHQVLYLSDGSTMEVRLRLSEMQDRLEGRSPFHFLSPGRGILVNAEAVVSFDADTLHLQSGRELPISKRRYGEFKRAMEKQLAGK